MDEMVIQPGKKACRSGRTGRSSGRIYKICLALLLSASLPAGAQFDANHPELRWKVLETAHFKIYYHQGLASFAGRAAKAAETVYGPVTAFYNFTPDEKIRLILKDTDDYANGAAFYYHNTMEIWASNLEFELRGDTNWLQNVIAHEFTHIVALQTARKGPRRLPAIYFHYLGYQNEERRDDILTGYPDVFASYAVPLTIVPPWFAEGTAQYMAPGVRFDRWDSHRDMILRMATLKNRLLTYDEMGVFGSKTGLGLEKVYDHGYALTLFIVNTFGEDKLPKIYNHMNSLWRTDFDSAVRGAIGISGRELHRRWVAALKERYEVQKSEVEGRLADGEILQGKGYFNLHPRWSPDGGQLAYLSNRGGDFGRTALVVYTLSDSSSETLAGGADTAPDWSPDGPRLIFARRSPPDRHGSRFWDLYTVDPTVSRGPGLFQKTGATLGLSLKLPPNQNRLTHGLRASHPAYSPDGKQIAFVVNGRGSTNLAVMDVEDGSVRRLTSFDDGSQVYTPRWSPDGSQIACSVFHPEGTRNIAIVPARGGRLSTVISSSGTDRDPCWTPDGAGLVFSSDQDGIFNLYHFSLTDGSVHRITRVLGGALQPHVNPNDRRIAFSHYGANGYEIRIVSGKGAWERVPSTIFQPETGRQPAVAFGDDPVPNSRSYGNEFSTTSFFPRVAVDAGKIKLGIFAGSNDVLNKQSLLVGAMAARDRDLDLFAVYEYRRWRPTVFLEAYRAVRHEEEDVLNRDENFRIFSQTFTISGVELGARHRLGAGGRLDARFIYNLSSTDQDVARFNGMDEVSLGATTHHGFNFAFRYSLRNVSRTRDREINPRAGREMWFRYDRQFNFFISGFKEDSSLLIETFDRYFFNRFTLNWNEYLPVGPGRSALGLRFYGGLIDSEVDDYFDFFLGGLPYMKGYTFYSLEGRRAAMFRAAFRFPIRTRMDRQTGPIYSDQLFGSIFAGIGRAWDGNEMDNVLNRGWKRDVGVQIRYDATSFYTFPTRASLDVAYGMDTLPRVVPGEKLEKSGFKFYFTLLFGYLQSVGGR